NPSDFLAKILDKPDVTVWSQRCARWAAGRRGEHELVCLSSGSDSSDPIAAIAKVVRIIALCEPEIAVTSERNCVRKAAEQWNWIFGERHCHVGRNGGGIARHVIGCI